MAIENIADCRKGMVINMKFLVINGPNINFLGIREPHLYGSDTYENLCNLIDDYCSDKGVQVEFFQSNHEGAIVDCIQKAYYDKIDGIVINPAAYTHTSVAIADAIKAVEIPTVEVHISDVSAREDFRQISYVKATAIKTYAGLGFKGYLNGVDTLMEYIQSK